MCRLCEGGQARKFCPADVDYMAPAEVSAADIVLGGAHGVAAQRAAAATMPAGLAEPGRRIVIRGGAVLSMDDAVGNFAQGDVLIEDGRIAAVAPAIDAGDAAVVEAAGKIVMPGFIDTHHHQFETGLRSVLCDAILVNDGRPESMMNYYEKMLLSFSQFYTPDDVYINELFGSISQLDAGVTTVMDVSQIHHSPEHSDAAIQGIRDAARRTVFGYFEGWGEKTRYPQDARRIREEHFASDDGLYTMVMGGEIYLPGHEESWKIGRELGIPIALHVVGTFGMQPTFDALGAAGQFGPDNIFIHMTGMSEEGWRHTRDAGAHVSLSVPVEMHMRHGMPPIQKALDLGIQPSLSSDVECTMTADFFTQMRSLLTLQRAWANEKALSGEDYPRLLCSIDAIRCATIEGARGLKLDHRTGSLTPGKEADVILLDAEAINVAPLNHVPGAVVTLMERTNVDSVFVAGKVRKWKGTLLGYDLARLRRDLEASRDRVLAASGTDQDLFRC
jgi:5-methylthioadenosine/S-adenosylhomocysteine deaminase